MPEIIRRDEGDARVVRHMDVASSAPTVATTLQRIVYFVMSLITALLLVRIVLSLLGANPDNTFANFIYTVSNPLVAPFRGLFGYQPQLGIARLEIESIIAIVVYLLIGWILINLLDLAQPRREVVERQDITHVD